MVDVQLALDRLKVDLMKGEEDDEALKDAMRRKIVELQMQLQQLRDNQEEKVGVTRWVWHCVGTGLHGCGTAGCVAVWCIYQ